MAKMNQWTNLWNWKSKQWSGNMRLKVAHFVLDVLHHGASRLGQINLNEWKYNNCQHATKNQQNALTNKPSPCDKHWECRPKSWEAKTSTVQKCSSISRLFPRFRPSPTTWRFRHNGSNWHLISKKLNTCQYFSGNLAANRALMTHSEKRTRVSKNRSDFWNIRQGTKCRIDFFTNIANGILPLGLNLLATDQPIWKQTNTRMSKKVRKLRRTMDSSRIFDRIIKNTYQGAYHNEYQWVNHHLRAWTPCWSRRIVSEWETRSEAHVSFLTPTTQSFPHQIMSNHINEFRGLFQREQEAKICFAFW